MPEVDMDIVYHFRVRGVGAEGVHIAGIARGFQAVSHRVTFVSPARVDLLAPRDDAEARQEKAGVWARLLHGVADRAPQSLFEWMEVSYNALAVPRLLHAVLRRNPTLLYERHAFFNLAGALVSLTTGVPLLLEVNELAGLPRVRPQRFVRLAMAAERFVLRRATLVIAVSDFLRDQALLRGATRAVTVPNGVPERLLCAPDPREVAALRTTLGLGERKVVCFVGYLVPWHNFDLLLGAMAKVARAVPGCALLLIGDGPLRASLLARARALGILDVVRLIGEVPHKDVARYIALSDAAVIPQTNEYRSPIKLFEYMAAGRAVVAPRMPPIEAVVAHEQSALLFPPGDEAALAAALTRVLTDTSLAATLGERARQVVRRQFTWEGHARRILSLAALTGTGAVATKREEAAMSAGSVHATDGPG
jgi:glycosyltransferase involved in cell wall biosynthesis